MNHFLLFHFFLLCELRYYAVFYILSVATLEIRTCFLNLSKSNIKCCFYEQGKNLTTFNPVYSLPNSRPMLPCIFILSIFLTQQDVTADYTTNTDGYLLTQSLFWCSFYLPIPLTFLLRSSFSWKIPFSIFFTVHSMPDSLCFCLPEYIFILSLVFLFFF